MKLNNKPRKAVVNEGTAREVRQHHLGFRELGLHNNRRWTLSWIKLPVKCSLESRNLEFVMIGRWNYNHEVPCPYMDRYGEF